MAQTDPVPRNGGEDFGFASVSESDRLAVAELLGRVPEGSFEVVVRDLEGAPRVIRNAPILFSGRPMPTLYWLVGAHDRLVVSRLESSGCVGQAEAELAPEAIATAHDAYARERDRLIERDYAGHRPSGGVAGTRVGVKCLHAHYAYYLAGGDDPVGRWVAERLAAKADLSQADLSRVGRGEDSGADAP